MVNVSNEYLEKINSLSKQVYWYGKVTLKNGTEYEFDETNLSQGQTSIRKELCVEKFGIGGTCSAELTIAFMLDYDEESDTYFLNDLIVNKKEFYEAEIELYFRLYLSDDCEYYEDIFIGTFIVTTPERTRYVLTCTAYDYMMKFSQPCVSEIQGDPYSTLLSACSICGVELGNTIMEIISFTNGQKNMVMYDPKNEVTTWRDVIGFIAKMLCANAIIKNNKLYLIPFKEEIDRYLDASQRLSLKLEDYTVSFGMLTSVYLRTNTQERITVNEDGLNYNYGGNPLIQFTDSYTRTDVLKRILNVLSSLDFVAFESEIFNDPSLELGDVIEFADNHGKDTKSIVTAISYSIGGHMSISCEGDDPYLEKTELAASESYSNQTSGSVGDGVQFYDFINSSDITVSGSDEVEICSITYDSLGKYRQEFLSELKIGVVTNEVEGQDSFTENDLDILVTYYLNGVEVASYHPQTTYTDGVFLMHLLYFWDSDMRIPESTFSATITVSGGTLTILEGNEHSRIMQSGKAYPIVSNNLEYIDVTREPDKGAYKLGEHLDYIGLVVSAFYEDGHTENITSQCVFNPPEGTEVLTKNYITVKVGYTKDEKTYITSFGLETNPLTAIEVTHDPDKTVYDVDWGNAHLDYTGIVVTAIYDDNTERDVTQYCVYDPPQGTQLTTDMGWYLNAKIYYTEYGVTKNTSYPFDLSRLTEIRITPPDNTTYMVGDLLDTTGLKVMAIFSGGNEYDVTALCVYSLNNGDKIREDDEEVKVDFTLDDKVFTDYYDLTLDIPFPIFPYLGYNASKERREVYVYYIDYYNLAMDSVSNFTLPEILIDDYSLVEYTTIIQYTHKENGYYCINIGDLKLNVWVKDGRYPYYDPDVFVGIVVSTPPSKTMYGVGEHLDYSGMVVSELYQDEHTEAIEEGGYTVSPADGTVVTDASQTVTITASYVKDEVSYSASTSVSVFKSIKVGSYPNKMQYAVGENLDYKGLVIYAAYDNNNIKDITKDCLINPSEGTQVAAEMGNTINVSVTYPGEVTFNTTFDVLVE